jgi:hypothetical protein
MYLISADHKLHTRAEGKTAIGSDPPRLQLQDAPALAASRTDLPFRRPFDDQPTG